MRCSDEIETLAVMLSAPFYAIEQGILVRITKSKRLVPKPGETGTTYGPPLKHVHVPPGIRARVIHAVHEELGHAGRDSTYSSIKQRFDWPTMYRDTVELVKHCANCQFHAGKALTAPIAGHLRADYMYPGHKVAMDILHLAKDTRCSGYMIIVIDVL